jgi:hypothetical protein
MALLGDLAEAGDCAAQFQDSEFPFKVCRSSPPTILSLDTPSRNWRIRPLSSGPQLISSEGFTDPAGIDVVLTVGSYGLYDPGELAEGRASMSNQGDDSGAKNRTKKPGGLVYSGNIDSILAQNRARKPPLRIDEIVRTITRGEPYPVVREMAKRWAEKLGISPAEFIKLAGPRS